MALRQRARVLLLLLRATVKRPARPSREGKKRKKRREPSSSLYAIVVVVVVVGGIKSMRLLAASTSKICQIDGEERAEREAAKIARPRAERLNGEKNVNAILSCLQCRSDTHGAARLRSARYIRHMRADGCRKCARVHFAFTLRFCVSGQELRDGDYVFR